MEGLSVTKAQDMYKMMLRIRLFEERVAILVESGEIRTPCHLYIGQEAIATGVCATLERQDRIWGGHRSHGHYLAKGGDLRAMMAELFGKATGCSRGRGGSMHLAAPDVGILGTVPLVAATIPLSVGSGLASKLKGYDRVSVAFFGDGATEEGHFHESMNLAALLHLPVVFVCENNLYASHMHLLERQPADNIQKAGETHSIPSVSLDGNDVIAIYKSSLAAVERGRGGGGPTFLECRTYRWRGHVGASWDIDVGVRRRVELNGWLAKDPLPRLRGHLGQCGITDYELDDIERTTREEIEEAVIFARRSPFPDRSTLMEHVFFQGEKGK